MPRREERALSRLNYESERPHGRLLAELALRDLWHDRKLSLCIVASLVAVVAPLLLLFGLKYGVVSQLRDNLLNNPSTLEVRMLGNGQFTQAWMDDLAVQPGVAFTVPLTRSLNTQADLLTDAQHFLANAEIIPSGPNDPLLGHSAPPTHPHELVLSARAAQALGVAVGDRVRLVVTRQLKGVTERGQLEMDVKAVLAPEVFNRPAALVSLDVLLAMEDFRDGARVPLLGLETGTARPEEAPRQYARARLYATDLDQVAVLADWLSAHRVESSTQLQEIESVKAISRVLGVIFSVVAWTAVLGCAASLAGAFLANLARKRRSLALLQLLGFRRSAMAGYVLFQACLLTLLAFALGYGLYGVGCAVFNQTLAISLSKTAFACRLEPWHVGLALLGTLGLSLAVAALGAWQAVQIQPAETLRDV